MYRRISGNRDAASQLREEEVASESDVAATQNRSSLFSSKESVILGMSALIVRPQVIC